MLEKSRTLWSVKEAKYDDLWFVSQEQKCLEYIKQKTCINEKINKFNGRRRREGKA